MSDDAILPLDEWHRANGARMASFAGYAMPIQYEGIIAEHLWTRENAGLFDVSHMGQIEVAGEGAVEALESLMPGDFAALPPGGVRYSLLLNETGGIIDDLMVTNAVHHYYLVVNGATKRGDIDHLRRHLPEDITLRHLDSMALLAVQGPKAVSAVASLGIVPMNEGWPEVENLTFMQAGPFEWDGVPLRISRSGYTGEDGFEIALPGGAAERFASTLVARDEVKPIGLGARDSLRLEAGLPLYGHDIDERTTPIEADLGFALSKRRREAGDFPGAAHILVQRERGAAKKRVGLTVEGRQPVREGAAVVDGDGSEIGTVTSGGFSPSLERPIAMAYVPAELAEPGTEIALEQRGKPFAGTVTALPFVPHRYHRKPQP